MYKTDIFAVYNFLYRINVHEHRVDLLEVHSAPRSEFLLLWKQQDFPRPELQA